MKEYEFDFDTDFDDASFDCILQRIFEEESKPSIIVPQRVKNVALAYNTLEKLFAICDVEVSYSLHAPFASVGTVKVEGDDLEVFDTKQFATACSLADNFEIYPLTNGKIRMAFTFHGLTKKLA